MRVDWRSALLGAVLAMPVYTVLGVVAGAAPLTILVLDLAGAGLYVVTEMGPVASLGRRLRMGHVRRR